MDRGKVLEVVFQTVRQMVDDGVRLTEQTKLGDLGLNERDLLKLEATIEVVFPDICFDRCNQVTTTHTLADVVTRAMYHIKSPTGT